MPIDPQKRKEILARNKRNPYIHRTFIESQAVNASKLTAAMDNTIAWRLGEICLKAASPEQKAGDPIDRGLILRRLLEEGGFSLILS